MTAARAPLPNFDYLGRLTYDKMVAEAKQRCTEQEVARLWRITDAAVMGVELTIFFAVVVVLVVCGWFMQRRRSNG
jgi:multidrug efflux pump subunit AcrB